MNKLYKCVFKKNLVNIVIRSSSLSAAPNRNISNGTQKKSFSTKEAAARTTTTTEGESLSSDDYKIIIPKRIHRSPTDILLALSATVGLDPTGAHYKFHDDPFLIPTSNVTKRTFAMAQESGRKAAKWIKEEHGEWFKVKIYIKTNICKKKIFFLLFIIA